MKTPFFIFLLFNLFIANAQQPAELFVENNNPGYALYVNNNAFSPVSLLLDLELDNLSFSNAGTTLFVIPAQTQRFKIGELSIINPRKKLKYSYQFTSVLGNTSLNAYDTNYVYDLPFAKGKSFMMYQGYNGKFSHRGENALDFTMPEGTEVVAAREGIVIGVVEKYTEACMREECQEYNNYVSIYHTDGTIADYTHLLHNGAKVQPGEVVKKGDVIALSGNTGWSSGPHLHFTCYLPSFDKRRSLPTKFKINKRGDAAYLQEKQYYTRDY